MPLRPLDFLEIRDGFIAFLEQPAGTSLDAVIPTTITDRMIKVARSSVPKRRLLYGATGGGAALATLGGLLGFLQYREVLWLPALIAGGALLIPAGAASKRRSELDIDTLVGSDDPVLRARLRALDEFKTMIAEGSIACQERLTDGTTRTLSKSALKAFVADHGSLLVLCRDQDVWQSIPGGPIPTGQLWVQVGDHVAKIAINARKILDTGDDALFERRIAWLLRVANQNNARARSFRSSVDLIVALRRADLSQMSFEEKKAQLATEGFGQSKIEKMHVGKYKPFETFLATLPLNRLLKNATV